MGGLLKIAKRVASGAEVWTKPDAATTRKLENPPTIRQQSPTTCRRKPTTDARSENRR
jgi:hypothetical protein